jgi:hypothetical protein
MPVDSETFELFRVVVERFVWERLLGGRKWRPSLHLGRRRNPEHCSSGHLVTSGSAERSQWSRPETKLERIIRMGALGANQGVR